MFSFSPEKVAFYNDSNKDERWELFDQDRPKHVETLKLLWEEDRRTMEDSSLDQLPDDFQQSQQKTIERIVEDGTEFLLYLGTRFLLPRRYAAKLETEGVFIAAGIWIVYEGSSAVATYTWALDMEEGLLFILNATGRPHCFTKLGELVLVTEAAVAEHTDPREDESYIVNITTLATAIDVNRLGLIEGFASAGMDILGTTNQSLDEDNPQPITVLAKHKKNVFPCDIKPEYFAIEKIDKEIESSIVTADE